MTSQRVKVRCVMFMLTLMSAIVIYLCNIRLTPLKGRASDTLSFTGYDMKRVIPFWWGHTSVKAASNRTALFNSSHLYHPSIPSASSSSSSSHQNTSYAASLDKPEELLLTYSQRKTTNLKPEKIPVGAQRKPMPAKPEKIPVDAPRKPMPAKPEKMPVDAQRKPMPAKPEKIPVDAQRKPMPAKPEKIPVDAQRKPMPAKPEKIPVDAPRKPMPTKPEKIPVDAPWKPMPAQPEKPPLTDEERKRVIKAQKEAGLFPWVVNVTGRHAEEVHHVVFVKVHKAASTTVFNILVRFSWSRQLNIMLPRRGHILSQHERGPGALQEHPQSPPFLFDILCNHVIFDHSQIRPYFHSDTRYIFILRHPWYQVQSAFHYYTTVYSHQYLKAAGSFHRFIGNQSHYETKNPLHSYTNNRMCVDLGLPHDHVGNSSYVIPFIRHLDSVFHLALIADRFDESMVLMKRMFRWTMKDVVYRKLNSQKEHKMKAWKPDSKLAEKFKDFQAFDFAVYEHYVKIFDQKIAKEGQDFLDELHVFIGVGKRISTFCNEGISPSVMVIPKSPWNDQFSIQRVECDILGAKEIRLNSVVQNRQFARLVPLIHN